MKKLISLKEAAKISGYHPDYLGYLIRIGKIEGEKVGRDWLTSEEALKNHLATKKFVSIKDFFLYKKWLKLSYLAIATILISIGIFIILIFNSPASRQKVVGDFVNSKEVQSKNVGELKITAYSLDDSGEIELSIQQPPNFLISKPSLFQKIIDFFR